MMISGIRFRMVFMIGTAFSASPGAGGCVIDCISETFQTPIRQFAMCGASFDDTCFHSDDSGKAFIATPESSAVSFTLSAPGYDDTLIAVTSREPMTRTIVLKENKEMYRLPKMTVIAASRGFDTIPYRESATRFTALDIINTAGTVEDIGRFIGTLPSAVASIGEGYDNTFYVRGGRPSEVIFLVDGIEMENIDHFSKANGSGGPIGFINASFIDNAQFFAGNMPVSSPPRLSSMVDIRMKNGSFTKGHGSAGCKLTGGLLAAEGPIVINKGSFAVSGRYVDFKPLRAFIQNAGIPKLGDVFGKVSLAPGDNMEVSATGLLSNSIYRYTYPLQQSDNGIAFDNSMMQKERIDQGGAGVSFRWAQDAMNHEANASLSFRKGMNADSLVNFSDSFYVSRFARNPVTQLKDNRRHFLLSTKSVLPLFREDLTLSFGMRLNRNDYAFSMADESQHSGKYLYCNNDHPDTLVWQLNPNKKSVNLHSMESGVFLEGGLNRGMIRISAGLRADYYGLLHDIAFSPRISGSVLTAHAGTFSGSAGLYHQFPTDMPSSIFSFFSALSALPNDTLFKREKECMERLQPLRCWQGSCGYERTFFEKVETKVEAYYKWWDREYNYISAEMQDIFTINDKGVAVMQNQVGRRKAYGVELSAGNRRDHRLFYSLAGSLFDVKNKYGNGQWHNDWTNVGATFSLDIGSRVGGHLLSVSLRGSGGRPTCGERIVVDCMGRKSVVLDTAAPFFSQRLSTLLMANLRYEYSIKIGNRGVAAFIEVLNVLNCQPTLEYKFNGDRFIEVKPFGFTPILGCMVNL
jgi:hypothetical protein